MEKLMENIAGASDWIVAGHQVRGADGGRREPTVLMLLDGSPTLRGLTKTCQFLGIDVESCDPEQSLIDILKFRKPIAICAELEGRRQDGCHVMKIVGEYDPALAGAADAVEDIWNLTGVTRWSEIPPVGDVVEFLSNAGRKGRCLSFMAG